jgi:hypothetical protein
MSWFANTLNKDVYVDSTRTLSFRQGEEAKMRIIPAAGQSYQTSSPKEMLNQYYSKK